MSIETPLQGRAAQILSPGQLRGRYIVALSLIAFLTIAAQALMQFLIAEQDYDSRVVNIAGRQRMLSQKITKLCFYIYNAESPQAAAPFRQDLKQTLEVWQQSHEGLQRGDRALRLPGQNSAEVSLLFARIDPNYRAIVDSARAILGGDGNRDELYRRILTIRHHEGHFLTGMDAIVFRYDREATERVEAARRIEFALAGVTLAVLMLEAMFIFAPAVRRIRRDMQELARREKDLELLFAVSPTALLLIDRKSMAIVHANEKAAALMGLPLARAAGSSLNDYLDREYPANRAFMEKIVNGESLNEYEVVLLDARQLVVETLVSVRAIEFLNQSVFVLGITNISELKKAQQTLEYYATFDEMTGLMNRRTGLLMLAKSMARVKRAGGKLTVCFIDVDGLKEANDGFGHAAGDWIIRATSQTLARVTRSSDAAVRLGGDEFLLILLDCSQEEAELLLERAHQMLADLRAAEQKPFALSFSHGIVAYEPERHGNADDLISAADNLMYLAKQAKKARDRDAVFYPAL
jgi:diguanylate cyclase (GGDEF)-like protein/PAS domain S-box-containing protein